MPQKNNRLGRAFCGGVVLRGLHEQLLPSPLDLARSTRPPEPVQADVKAQAP